MILEKDGPSNVFNALSQWNLNFFHSISYLLNVLGTLPVSTSTPERTFSTLKRLKTFLRNRIGQERLVGLLALMSVHNIEKLKLTLKKLSKDFQILRGKLNQYIVVL